MSLKTPVSRDVTPRLPFCIQFELGMFCTDGAHQLFFAPLHESLEEGAPAGIALLQHLFRVELDCNNPVRLIGLHYAFCAEGCDTDSGP